MNLIWHLQTDQNHKRLKKILITGVAGFIGSALASKLIHNFEVFGLDNFDEYYDVEVKRNILSNPIHHA